MDENGQIEEQTREEETPTEVETPVEESPPAWDFPTFTPRQEAPAEEPGVYDTLRSEAATEATKAIGGLLQNQSSLRNTLMSQGASPETIALAEATLLSMDPRVMTQPGAAQIAASLAIGQQTMQGKSWKQAPPPSIPPPANSVGKEHPTQSTPEQDKAIADFNRAFAKMGLTADMFEVPDA